MLDGVNDSDQHARELVALVRHDASAVQVQPDSVQPVPGVRLKRSIAGAIKASPRS